MPSLLTLQYHLPFAAMSDKCIAKIEQCRKEGKDFSIRVWSPKDPETIKLLGSGTRIATVIVEETDDAAKSQEVD